jgi:hypothetical protein
MDWPTVVISLIGSAVVGPVSVGVSKFLSYRSIERQKAKNNSELVESQNTFSVGATMAIVAFDKHICFCEEYVKEMSEALRSLNEDGRIEAALDVTRFFRIRQKWALWLTQEMENELDQFERKLTLMGGEARSYGVSGPASNESSIKTMIAILRKVLRVEELTTLRNELVIHSYGPRRQVQGKTVKW